VSVDETGKWSFSALDQGVETLDGTTVPFDAFVNIEGEALQHGSRPDLRPFNKEELQNILRVGQCVGCHDSYSDPVWTKYDPKAECTRPE